MILYFQFQSALIQLLINAEMPSQRVGGGYKLVNKQKPIAIIAPIIPNLLFFKTMPEIKNKTPIMALGQPKRIIGIISIIRLLRISAKIVGIKD